MRSSSGEADWSTGFGAALEAWSATLVAPATRTAYRSDLAAFGRWCLRRGSVPQRADPATVAAYLLEQEAAGHRPATVRRHRSALSSFFRFAVETRVADTNPVGDTVHPQAGVEDETTSTRLLSPVDIASYLDAAMALGPRVEALVGLIVFDGLKLGEALAVDVDDIRGRPPRVSIALQRRATTVRLTLDPLSARAVRRCAEGRAGQPLFTSTPRAAADDPRRLTRFGADHLIKQLAPAGDPPVSANALRRFHIVANHARGTELDTVRARAGLTDVRTVLRHLPPDATGSTRGTSSRES